MAEHDPVRADRRGRAAAALRHGDRCRHQRPRAGAPPPPLQRALPELECVPAYASVLLRFDPAAWSHDGKQSPHARLQAAVMRTLRTAGALNASRSREIVIPVCYGGEFGPDLAEVAAHAGLGEAEVIERHARRPLSRGDDGLRARLSLSARAWIRNWRCRAAPIRASACRPAAWRSAASQTGIYPEALPGGWQLIGRTPQPLFDLQRRSALATGAGRPRALRGDRRGRFAALERGSRR